jgi:hypothetical protein
MSLDSGVVSIRLIHSTMNGASWVSVGSSTTRPIKVKYELRKVTRIVRLVRPSESYYRYLIGTRVMGTLLMAKVVLRLPRICLCWPIILLRFANGSEFLVSSVCFSDLLCHVRQLESMFRGDQWGRLLKARCDRVRDS